MIEKCDEFQSFKQNFHDSDWWLQEHQIPAVLQLSCTGCITSVRWWIPSSKAGQEHLNEGTSGGVMVQINALQLGLGKVLPFIPAFAGLHSKLRSKESDKRRCQGTPSRVMSVMIVSKRHSNGAWCCGGLAPGVTRCIQRYDFSNAGANTLLCRKPTNIMYRSLCCT
jgi:hypothetical protein